MATVESTNGGTCGPLAAARLDEAMLPKHCENCGAELGAAEPFAICAKCLFGTALTTHETPEASAPPTTGKNNLGF